jgi:hypothetical protein
MRPQSRGIHLVASLRGGRQRFSHTLMLPFKAPPEQVSKATCGPPGLRFSQDSANPSARDRERRLGFQLWVWTSQTLEDDSAEHLRITHRFGASRRRLTRRARRLLEARVQTSRLADGCSAILILHRGTGCDMPTTWEAIGEREVAPDPGTGGGHSGTRRGYDGSRCSLRSGY